MVYAPCSFELLKGASTITPQLALVSIAPYILLTRPAALGYMAQVIARAGHVQYLKRILHPNAELRTHQVLDGVRLLGMPAAMMLAHGYVVVLSSLLLSF